MCIQHDSITYQSVIVYVYSTLVTYWWKLFALIWTVYIFFACCKLPSVKQVFSHFLHRHNVLKEDIRTAANRTIERVDPAWFRATIPIKHRQDSIKKLEQLFCQWKGLKKDQRRQTQTQQANEAKFLEMVEELFDIAHANAMELIENEEDKFFLESQRKRDSQAAWWALTRRCYNYRRWKQRKRQGLS